MRTAIYIIAFIVITIGLALTIRSGAIDMPGNDKEANENSKSGKDERPSGQENNPSGQEFSSLQVLKKHDLPSVLQEVSAIVYLENNRFACVQDEDGTIYIYNSSTEKIEKEIPFAEAGDYEGLAISGDVAYVLKSDGEIFEVKNYMGTKPVTNKYKTHLTGKNNAEGMCFDRANNRLLVAIKGKEKDSDAYKGIYSFDLATHSMNETPAYEIDLENKLFDGKKEKKKSSQMQPSEIAIHPKTGDMYILEGSNPKLLVMSNTGTLKSLIKLDKKEFNQPEGITFSPEGKMYISNEGTNDPGNILEVEGVN